MKLASKKAAEDQEKESARRKKAERDARVAAKRAGQMRRAASPPREASPPPKAEGPRTVPPAIQAAIDKMRADKAAKDAREKAKRKEEATPKRRKPIDIDLTKAPPAIAKAARDLRAAAARKQQSQDNGVYSSSAVS